MRITEAEGFLGVLEFIARWAETQQVSGVTAMTLGNLPKLGVCTDSRSSVRTTSQPHMLWSPGLSAATAKDGSLW